MSNTLTFNSQFEVRGSMPIFPDDVIRDEIMFFSCGKNFAREHGGPITQAFLDALPKDWADSDFILDSRVHMLMPGWLPCIPGWHLDDVPRTRPDGQPDHADPEYRAEHLLCCVGDASLTLFAIGEIQLEDIAVGQGVVYGQWHNEIERLCAQEKLTPVTVKQGDLVQFNWQSFHRGTAASKNGWRWFCRITRNTKRAIHNSIRRQTQVYLTNPDGGW